MGGLWDDVLAGTSGAIRLLGGRNGDDDNAGGLGDDTLSGGLGDDTISGGRGLDSMDGGQGYDRVEYSYSSDDWAIDLQAGLASRVGSAGSEIVTRFEEVIGSDGDDETLGTGQGN
ncbi:MAG: hypothetical protein AAFU80_02555 [Pseudomonadota bacterium]